MRRILVVADWTDWEDELFRRHYPHAEDRVDVVRTRLNGSYEGVKRGIAWAKYLGLAFKVLRLEREYDAVIVWQQVVAYFLVALRPLFSKRRPPVILTGFIWSEKKRPLSSKIRRALVQTALNTVRRVVCYSARERQFCIDSFGQPEEKVRFVPLGMDFPFSPPESESDYVLSAGKSGRDYRTLVEAAKSVDAPFKILTPRELFEKGEVPANVDFIEEKDWEAFAELMGRARVVAIPLAEEEKTAGQLVLLQAMHFGRPIVVTRSRGTEDYVDDGGNGLLVKANDPSEFARALRRLLDDEGLRSAMGRRAREDAAARYSSRLFWISISQLVDEITGYGTSDQCNDPDEVLSP